MDIYCDNPDNYIKDRYCQLNYRQIPYANMELTQFEKCSTQCGGGTQTRTCRVIPDLTRLKAVRKVIESFEGGNDQNYYIINDTCANQNLEQKCNIQSCSTPGTSTPKEPLIKKTNVLIIFLISVFVMIFAGGIKHIYKKNNVDPLTLAI